MDHIHIYNIYSRMHQYLIGERGKMDSLTYLLIMSYVLLIRAHSNRKKRRMRTQRNDIVNNAMPILLG